MPTTNLTINSRDTSSGDHSLAVTVRSPLFLKELILVPHPSLASAIGKVLPGTVGIPRSRTIYLPPTHLAFTTPTPFTLPVTYAAGTFIVSTVGNPAQLLGGVGPSSNQLEELER